MGDVNVNLAIWECSWIPRFKQQFILEKTVTRIYITRRTISGIFWDNYLVKCQISLVWKNWVRRNYMEIDKLIVRKSLSDHYFQSPCLLRLSTLYGRDEKWPKRSLDEQMKWYLQNNYLKELNRIDGMQTEFEWEIFPGFTTSGIVEEIQKFMKSFQCEPEHFNGGIIFMSMFDDIMWEKTEECLRMLKKYRSLLTVSFAVVGHSWDLDKKRHGTRLVLFW